MLNLGDMFVLKLGCKGFMPVSIKPITTPSPEFSAPPKAGHTPLEY
ncbi:hypothetical protein LINPERHAP2_LOCUS31511 [Linum perenne]